MVLLLHDILLPPPRSTSTIVLSYSSKGWLVANNIKPIKECDPRMCTKQVAGSLFFSKFFSASLYYNLI